jgi:hypothetical protein
MFIFIEQDDPSLCLPPRPPGCRTIADAAIGLMQAMLAPKRLSPSRALRPVFVQSSFFFFFFFLFSWGRSIFVYLSARQDDVRIAHFSTATTRSTLTSVTLALRDYHLHVVLIGFYSSHNIHAITMLQLWGDVSSPDSDFDLFSGLTVCGAPAMTVGGY